MTDVRFSIRFFLIVTAVVAIAATALGAFIRQFSAIAQSRLILYWLLLFIAVGVIVAYVSFRRYRAEKQAGRLIPSVQRLNGGFPNRERRRNARVEAPRPGFAPHRAAKTACKPRAAPVWRPIPNAVQSNHVGRHANIAAPTIALRSARSAVCWQRSRR